MSLSFSDPIADPILVFFTLLAVVLLAPLLFQRIRLPGLIGLIVVGVAIGPNGLNLIEVEGTITLLGSVGLLYIMFLAGLEIDLHQFARQKDRSLVFGAITFAIPQVAGTAFFLALGFDWAAAILIASMFASHTLVAYPVVARLGITRNNAVVTTVGGTILTDTAALLVLAVVAHSAEGILDTAFWILLAVFLTLYVTAVVTLLPRIGRWFFRRVENQTAEFLFVLTAAFGCAYLAELAGVEPIVGAFLAGLVLNRLVPESSPLMNRTQFVGNALFIPFFLLYIGMLVDLEVLFESTRAWGVMGAMVAMTVVTKFIASKLTQRIYRYSTAEGWVIFGLSTCQAAATLAATLVGYDLGIIGEEVLNGVILMILVTCILGPYFVERFGRRVAIEERDRPYDPSEAPQRILGPLANPDTADALMSMAYMVRTPDTSDPVFPLTVASAGNDVPAQVAASEKLLAHTVEHAAAADVPVAPLTRVDVNVANGIARAIVERRGTTVVIGWDGDAPRRPRIFGGIIDQLLEQTMQEVLVCKLEHPPNTHRRIVVVVPAFAEREFGFADLAQGIKRMASEMGDPIVLAGDRARINQLQKQFTAIRPEVPLRAHPIPDAASTLDVLDELLNPNDLLVLVSARHGTVSWRPGLDRLPRTVATRYAENSLVVAYPTVTEQPARHIVGASATDTAPPESMTANEEALVAAAEPDR